jgi:hypothetical protein
MPPKVTAANTPHGRPTVAAGAGRDPVTGSTMLHILEGNGATVTDASQVRIRLALLQARVGDLIEVVAPADSVNAVAGQSAVMVIAVEPG